MPELPEVETVLRGLSPVMEGKSFLNVEQRRANLRFPFPEFFVERLVGQKIVEMGRRAKFLWAELGNGETLVMHLGMSGRFIIDSDSECQKPGAFFHSPDIKPVHTHAVFVMSGGAQIHYNDPRRFGYMELVAQGRLKDFKSFAHLGVEPLSENLTPLYLSQKAQNKSVTVKSFLMDQRVVAGLGNIYVCEALFRAKLSPLAEASVLTRKSGSPSQLAHRLVPAIKSVLEEAIDAGGSSLRDHRQANGSLGYFQHRFDVYGRAGEPCNSLSCKGKIERITQNGRTSFHCPHCQRRK